MIMPPDTGPASDGGKQPRLSKFIGKIADIEAADLTDQQLRAARKLAAKRGIAASSDLDAVQQLKALVARGKTRAEKPARSKPGNAPPPAPGEQFDLLRDIEGELVSRRRAAAPDAAAGGAVRAGACVAGDRVLHVLRHAYVRHLY